MSFPEAAAHFLGYRYAFATKGHRSRVPVIRDPLPSSLLWEPGMERRIDCSGFITAALAFAYADLVEWDAQAYGEMQVFDAGRPWSPVECWTRHNLGAPLPNNEHAQGWGVYQGWVSAEPGSISGGHQWAYHGGMGVRVHSTIRGGIGPIWERAHWEDLVGFYRAGIHGVALGLVP